MEKKKIVVMQRGSRPQLIIQRGNQVQPTHAHDDEEELAHLCRLLRIASERDTDGTVVQVVKILIERGKTPVRSSDLSRESGINRITVIHHLKRLTDAGIVEKHDSQYLFAYENIEDMVQMMRIETVRMFEEMEEIAKKIDEDFMVDDYGQGRRTEISGTKQQIQPAKRRKIKRAGER